MTEADLDAWLMFGLYFFLGVTLLGLVLMGLARYLRKKKAKQNTD